MLFIYMKAGAAAREGLGLLWCCSRHGQMLKVVWRLVTGMKEGWGERMRGWRMVVMGEERKLVWRQDGTVGETACWLSLNVLHASGFSAKVDYFLQNNLSHLNYSWCCSDFQFCAAERWWCGLWGLVDCPLELFCLFLSPRFKTRKKKICKWWCCSKRAWTADPGWVLWWRIIKIMFQTFLPVLLCHIWSEFIPVWWRYDGWYAQTLLWSLQMGNICWLFGCRKFKGYLWMMWWS